MILVGFSFPISFSIATIILAIMLVLWLIEGNFYEKYKTIKNNPISYAIIAFFITQHLGVLWSSNVILGLHWADKEWRIYSFLILITIVRKKHIRYYILSFLLAMTISEILSYAVWLHIIPPILHATVYEPIIFMTHIPYNPLLAFTIFIMLYLTFMNNKKGSIIKKILSVLFIVSMSINMFITGGRAGQVGYFVMLCLFIFLYFKNNIKKSIIIIFMLIPTIFILFYSTSHIFQDRVNLAINNVKNISINRNTSVGLRITLLENTLKIIKKNPFFGVGTGDFLSEYKKMNSINTKNAKVKDQPHNMYIFVLAQLGIFGLIPLLSIFFIQLQLASHKSGLKPLKLALPILFLTIMLSDSYLLNRYVGFLFAYFSSFLYKDYGDEDL